MRTLAALAGVAVLALAGSPAQATDFGPLMDVVHATWPEKTHIAIVADYRASRGAIAALAEKAGSDSLITVLDITSVTQLDRAGAVLLKRVKPDYLVLLPDDPLVWDGSFWATRLVEKAALKGLPTIATTPATLDHGVVFAVGEKTGFELLVTKRLLGTVGVILPGKGGPMNSTASFQGGSARITLVAGL